MENIAEISVNNMLIELKDVVDRLKAKQIKHDVIHTYVFHYEADSDNENDVYYVNVKVCYSSGEQDTVCDGMTFEKLDDCQSHIKYVESKLIESGYGDDLLVDVTPN